MTSASKSKYVVKDMLEDFSVPQERQQIVKVLGNSGSNLHEAITTKGERLLCSLPMKFRRNIWIQRGSFVVVEPIREGVKVKAEIIRILYPQHVKYLQSGGNWPEEFRSFDNSTSLQVEGYLHKASDLKHSDRENMNRIADHCGKSIHVISDREDFSSDDEMSDVPANTNRLVFHDEYETSDADSEDESDSEC